MGWDEYKGPAPRVGVGGAARPERWRGVGRAHAPELKGRWDGRPRTCRESSRNAAWKSCLPGAGRRLRLWKPGPAGDGAGALLSSRAAPGRILPGQGAGPRRGPRCTPGPRPRARRAAVCAALWAKRRSARGRGGRARAWKQERPARTAGRHWRGSVPRRGARALRGSGPPPPPRPAPGRDPTPGRRRLSERPRPGSFPEAPGAPAPHT